MRGSGLGLEVYADADYADKANDRRSVSGIAVTLGGTVVSHASKTQHVVSLSTLEAEYIAPETSGVSIKVLEDNQKAKALIENPLSSARSKHIDVRFYFIRDLVRSRKISVEDVASAEQHADILIKALSRANFQYHRKRLMDLSEQGTLALDRLFQATNVPGRYPRQAGCRCVTHVADICSLVLLDLLALKLRPMEFCVIATVLNWDFYTWGF